MHDDDARDLAERRAQGDPLIKMGDEEQTLAMIEDDAFGVDLSLAHPVRAIHQVSQDPSLAQVVELRSGTTMTALEVQWEIEEVLEAAAPKAPVPDAPPPPAEPPPPANPQQISMKDLVTVYDDPRGLLLHRTKVGERYFATQSDPYTGQPQTFEIPAHEFTALKTKLAGSPYWVLGASGPAAG